MMSNPYDVTNTYDVTKPAAMTSLTPPLILPLIPSLSPLLCHQIWDRRTGRKMLDLSAHVQSVTGCVFFMHSEELWYFYILRIIIYVTIFITSIIIIIIIIIIITITYYLLLFVL